MTPSVFFSFCLKKIKNPDFPLQENSGFFIFQQKEKNTEGVSFISRPQFFL